MRIWLIVSLCLLAPGVHLAGGESGAGEVERIQRGAVTLLEAGNPEAAAVLLERACELAPQSLLVRYTSGWCARRLGDDEMAAAHFRAVLELAEAGIADGVALSEEDRKRVAGARLALEGGDGDGGEAPSLAGARLPVPDEEERAAALATLREGFGERLDDPEGDVGRELMAELLAQAEHPANAGAVRYVLLQLVVDLAPGVGDPAAAWAAARILTSAYAEVDADLVEDLLRDCYRETGTAERFRVLARVALEIADHAVRAEDFTLAAVAARRAERSAREAQAALLYRRAGTYRDRIRAVERLYRSVQRSRAVLAKNPEDARANETVGRYLCFVRGEWARGLPRLAKGLDRDLAAAAEQDMGATGSFLGGPAGPGTQVAVADGWLELAREADADDLERAPLAGRALRFYRQALPALQGVRRIKVAERIEICRTLGPQGATLISLDGCVLHLSFDRADVADGEDGLRLRNTVADGTLATASALDFADGVHGQAAVFDGTESVVQVANSPELQVIGDQTVACWLRPAALAARRNPCYKAYGGELTLTLEPDGKVNYYYGTAGEDAHPYQGFALEKPVTVGTWTHIALVRDLEARELHWYRDGELVASVKAAYPAAVASTAPLKLGTGYAGRYHGALDEFYLFARALAADEIKRLATR